MVLFFWRIKKRTIKGYGSAARAQALGNQTTRPADNSDRVNTDHKRGLVGPYEEMVTGELGGTYKVRNEMKQNQPK